MQEKSKRVRRDPKEARAEILKVARGLFQQEGPDGIRIARIAKKMGVSHGTLLYHFKTTEALKEALYQEMSLAIRQDLLVDLANAGDQPLIPLFNEALKRMSSPEKGTMLSWILATGRDPFPDSKEKGLSQIAEILSTKREVPQQDAQHLILLSVLAMFGECLVGDPVRERVGVESSEEARDAFRLWMLGLIGREVARLS